MTHLKNPCTDPYFNLALEEHLLKSRGEEEFFMLWRNAPSVICGRGQNIFEEVDTYAAEVAGVPVVKRFSGGGTVYHDLGNVNYTFVSNSSGEGTEYERFILPVVEALRSLGAPAELSGVCDITAAGRKVSGNAQAHSGTRVLHHGTLLFDCDLERLDSLTGRARPVSGIESRAIKSRVAGVGNLSEFMPFMGVSEFMEALARLICTEASVPVTKADAAAARELAETKYRTWKWNGGSCPRFTFSGKHHSEDISYTAYRGVIESVANEKFRFLEGVRLTRCELETALSANGEDVSLAKAVMYACGV